MQRQTGLSLVEMLVAIAISLLLILGIGQIYLSNIQTSKSIRNLSRVQESARFASDTLVSQLRMAGYSGCPKEDTVNVLNKTDSSGERLGGAPAVDSLPSGVRGIPNDEDGTSASDADYADALPAFGTDTGDRIAGTDAIWLQGGGGDTYGVEKHNPSSATIFLTDTDGLANGDIVMLCDHEQSAIFQITNVNNSGSDDKIVHNTGSSETPGNCTKGLKAVDSPCGSDGRSDEGSNYEYGKDHDDASLTRFESVGYYIGVGTGGEPALYRRELVRVSSSSSSSPGGDSSGGIDASSSSGGGGSGGDDSGGGGDDDGSGGGGGGGGGGSVSLEYQNQELITGIANMQLRYGVDTDDDGVPNQYQTADDDPEWDDVVTVEVGTLVRSPEADVTEEDDDTTYNLAGTAIGPGTTINHDGDNRLRLSFNHVIRIRNQL